MGAIVQTDYTRYNARERIGDRDIRGGRSQRKTLDRIHAETCGERAGNLGHSALGRNIVIVLWSVLNRKALTAQPRLNRIYLRLGRRKLLAELSWRQKGPVTRAGWIGDGLGQSFNGGRIVPSKIDAKAHVIAGVGRSDVVLSISPTRDAARKLRLSLGDWRESERC